MKSAITIALVCALGSSAAEDPLSEPAFQHFYNLEYEQALEAFVQRATANPKSPSAQNHIAQTVMFQAMFQHGALESDLISATNPLVSRPKLPVTPEQKQRFEGAIAKAIELAQVLLQANPKDSEALYAYGVSVGLRANWNYLVNKAWIDPLRDATHARKLHGQATDINAGLYDARLVQGVHDYLLGSLPMTFKMLGFLAGFHGDREGGIRTLRSVVEKGSANRADATVLLAAILRREKRQSQAVPLLVNLTAKFPRNYLFRYELALLHADLGDRTKALQQIETIEQIRAKATPGVRSLTAERIEYMRGNVLLILRDYDTALSHLTRAVAGTPQPQNPNQLAQAWLRMGQAYDAKGRRREAVNAYRQALQVGPQTASAREAKDYLSSPFKQSHA